jgi:hypothetical protein
MLKELGSDTRIITQQAADPATLNHKSDTKADNDET